MEMFLKESKYLNKNGASSNNFEEISLLIYLANLTQDEITTIEIETASNILRCAIKNLYDDWYNVVQNILYEEKMYIFLTDKSSRNTFKVHIKDTWLFKLILVNSLKHSDILSNSQSGNIDLLIFVINYIIKNTIITKPLSSHLLKILLLIVTKRNDTLSPKLCLEILSHMNKVALSPITLFRQSARDISKAVCPFISKEDGILLNFSLLPVRGIDMCDIVKYFPKWYIRENQEIIIKKVLRMFQKNIESKDGGTLYECFVFYSFDDWKREIWPLFLDPLKNIDYEGEFFQSLLKYWITINVSAYKGDFYDFLRYEPIDWTLKGYVLMESRKKGCAIDHETAQNDILRKFNSIETRTLRLRLAVTYHKRSLSFKTYETDIVMDYLYSNTNTSLQEEETKCFSLFFSQMFLNAHSELLKGEQDISNYVSVIEVIYKYCIASLKTDYYAVAAEVIYILWNIAAGSHKDLVLSYRLEKKDCYLQGENRFYKTLKERNMWWFESETFQMELVNCFSKVRGYNVHLTRLFTTYVHSPILLRTINLKNIIDGLVVQISFDSEQIIRNYSEIVYRDQNCGRGNLEFLEEINEFIFELSSHQGSYSEEMIFKTVLYLEIVIVAIKCDRYNLEKLPVLIEKSLYVVECIVNHNSASNHATYKKAKVLEAFINKVVLCIAENIDNLWKSLTKETMVKYLTMIIQKSNMKRPMSLSVEVLKRIGYKMNENDLDGDYKIWFLNETLESLYLTGTRSNLKMRRYPESRLVIHAMCISDTSPNKPFIKWVLTYLSDFISEPTASDSAVASALHSIEILISDNSLQNPTLPFISDIITQCVELFARSSWIVRNADLQLTRAIIDRFYGVCLDICNRPKCVADLFTLFPELSSYFYKILSSEILDERAVLVFQFFSESQIREDIFTSELCYGCVKPFLQLFMDIMQNYPNHYGKMATRSFSALCASRRIPQALCSVIRYFEANFRSLSKNIFANFVFLIQQLYEKYKTSFQCCIDKEGIKVVNFALTNLLKRLRKCDGHLFDLILFKVKPRDVILSEFEDNLNCADYQKRVWLHNNIPFLLNGTKTEDLKDVLSTILWKNLSSCIQIKVLTVLVSKFENNEFNSGTLNKILEILFVTSFTVDDTDNYLLNCYYKTILVFYKSNNCPKYKNVGLDFAATNNLYKVMIFVLYFSRRTKELNCVGRPLFFNTVESTYMSFVSFKEEIKNDIISTLPYIINDVPKNLLFKILKLVFYSSLFTSTYLEACKCIQVICGNYYSNILSALKDLMSTKILCKYLDDRLLKKTFDDVVKYIPEHFQETKLVGYYVEESDILVPKLFLERLINREILKECTFC